MAAPEKKKRQPKKKFCVESGCKDTASTKGYCRLHYIGNWRIIKFDQKVKAERKLNAYIEGMSRRYPKDFMDRIKEGLESDDKFKETVDALVGDDEAQANETEREFVERLRRNYKIED